MRKTTVAGLGAVVLSAAAALAQGPVTNRMAPTTLRGVIIEITCFRQQGAATGPQLDQAYRLGASHGQPALGQPGA